jgi:hypothetical protein
MTAIRKNSHIVERLNLTTAEKQDAKEKIGRMRSEDLKLVKGIFKNLECPGGCVKFYQRKYKEESVGEYFMWDGREYEVPLYVAKYLNNNCVVPVHAMTTDADGKPVQTVGQMKNRFAFISRDFQ